MNESYQLVRKPMTAKAIVYIKDYVKMRPNKVYRKKFCNFLQQRTWETEPLTDYRRPAARQENPNDCTTHTNKNAPMEQTLPLPYISPGAAVLARVRQFARIYRPQCEDTENR